MVNNVFLIGHVMRPGPLLTTAADGVPCCRLQVCLEKLVVVVEVLGQHGWWTTERVAAGDIVLMEGKLHREPSQGSAVARRARRAKCEAKELHYLLRRRWESNMNHDPVFCLQRLREHVRRRLEISGWLAGRDGEAMMLYVCFCIAKLATDPSGLSLLTDEVALSEEQITRLQRMPVTQVSRAERVRMALTQQLRHQPQSNHVVAQRGHSYT